MTPVLKVLVFDDELSQRPAFYRQAELDLKFYADADDAVRIVAAEHPDVVMMDFTMGAALSGAAAVRRIRERHAAVSAPARSATSQTATSRTATDQAARPQPAPSPLRIVAISSDPAANQHMIAAGADDAIPKSHVRAYLQRLIEHARLLRREENFSGVR